MSKLKEYQWEITKSVDAIVIVSAESEEEAKQKFEAGEWDTEDDIDCCVEKVEGPELIHE